MLSHHPLFCLSLTVFSCCHPQVAGSGGACASAFSAAVGRVELVPRVQSAVHYSEENVPFFPPLFFQSLDRQLGIRPFCLKMLRLIFKTAWFGGQ